MVFIHHGGHDRHPHTHTHTHNILQAYTYTVNDMHTHSHTRVPEILVTNTISMHRFQFQVSTPLLRPTIRNGAMIPSSGLGISPRRAPTVWLACFLAPLSLVGIDDGSCSRDDGVTVHVGGELVIVASVFWPLVVPQVGRRRWGPGLEEPLR